MLNKTNIDVTVSTGKKIFLMKWNTEKQVLHIETTSQPNKGKANEEILKELKRFFKNDTIIIKGKLSRKKIIQVSLDNQATEELLCKLTQTNSK